MGLQRVYEDITKIKLVEALLGTTVIHTSPFVHFFHAATGEIELSNESGDTFRIAPPETLKGLTVEVQLWQDTEQDLVAFRYLYKDADAVTKADIRIGFYFSVDASRVKVKIEGTLSNPITLKIPLKSLKHFIRGNCFWDGIYNEEMGIIERGVGFDWGDIKNAMGDACRWNGTDKYLEIDVPQIFTLDPNTVTTAAGVASYYTFEKKILRTSDGTIHVILARTGYITHYYSHDDGQNWDSVDVWAVNKACAIAKDSNDNLVAVYAEATNVFFKKATADKGGSPWTWSWGTGKTVDSAYATFYFPDIVVDSNNYFHVVYERSDGYPRWARCLDGTGDSWTVTELTGFSAAVCAVSIVKDTYDNLFVFGARTDRVSLLRAVKITYNGGTSWTVGTYYNVSGANAYPACTHILPNNKLVVTYCINVAYDLKFKKSTNASDVSAWDTEVAIKTGIDARYSHGLMVIDDNKIRVYYCDGNYLCYKESTDGGAAFGSEQNVYTTGVNSYPNVAKTAVNSKIDYVWMNGTADPYTIYHQYHETAIFKEVTDSLSSSDGILCNKTLPISDTVELADLPLKDWAPAIADSINLSEIVEVITGAIIKYTTDTIGLTEQVKINKTFVVSDTINILDQIFRHKPSVAVTDALALAETIVAVKTLAITDQIALSDMALILKQLRVIDAVNLTDVVSTPTRVLHALDSVGLSENAYVNKILIVSDQMVLAETVEKMVAGGLKTRIFLVLGDLAIQLSG